MASEYPLSSKILDAKWYRKHMKCRKGVAYDYIQENSKFRNHFGKCEKALQQFIDELEEKHVAFLQKNLSETAKAKIENMENVAKKESDEKKAKKSAEKYNKKISPFDQLMLDAQKDKSKKEKEKKKKEIVEEDGDDIQAEGKEIKKVGPDDFPSSPVIVEGVIKYPQKISTDDVDSSSDTTGDASLAVTPKKKDVPQIHQQLVMFSKANLFAVSRNGVEVDSKIELVNNTDKSKIVVSID